jgi:hypothetical protein
LAVLIGRGLDHSLSEKGNWTPLDFITLYSVFRVYALHIKVYPVG